MEISLNRTRVRRRRTLRALFAERNFTHAKRLIATTTIPIRRRGVARTLAVHLHVLGLANSKIIVNVFTANLLLPPDNVPGNLQSGGARLKNDACSQSMLPRRTFPSLRPRTSSRRIRRTHKLRPSPSFDKPPTIRS